MVVYSSKPPDQSLNVGCSLSSLLYFSSFLFFSFSSLFLFNIFFFFSLLLCIDYYLFIFFLFVFLLAFPSSNHFSSFFLPYISFALYTPTPNIDLLCTNQAKHANRLIIRVLHFFIHFFYFVFSFTLLCPTIFFSFILQLLFLLPPLLFIFLLTSSPPPPPSYIRRPSYHQFVTLTSPSTALMCDAHTLAREHILKRPTQRFLFFLRKWAKTGAPQKERAKFTGAHSKSNQPWSKAREQWLLSTGIEHFSSRQNRKYCMLVLQIQNKFYSILVYLILVGGILTPTRY